jgi:hypothetical protein
MAEVTGAMIEALAGVLSRAVSVETEHQLGRELSRQDYRDMAAAVLHAQEPDPAPEVTEDMVVAALKARDVVRAKSGGHYSQWHAGITAALAHRAGTP